MPPGLQLHPGVLSQDRQGRLLRGTKDWQVPRFKLKSGASIQQTLPHPI